MTTTSPVPIGMVRDAYSWCASAPMAIPVGRSSSRVPSRLLTTTGGLWPAFTYFRVRSDSESAPKKRVTNMPDFESSVMMLFASNIAFAGSRCQSAFTLTTIRESAMKSAAGTPFPDTSATRSPRVPFDNAMISKGITSKKSPPTSFAMTVRAAISNPLICGITSGMKLRWISAAIWSSAFERASFPSISRRSVMSRIVSMAPVTFPSGS
ncbi:MAG: hypothetical protein A4E41_00850 [Methanoregulaceae archaeon PtaU1.Bin066]|nr:MAG: hypothetical protein A4E41_00850 [Methanoregulaceae archaeon PtaU1.Bin066]